MKRRTVRPLVGIFFFFLLLAEGPAQRLRAAGRAVDDLADQTAPTLKIDEPPAIGPGPAPAPNVERLSPRMELLRERLMQCLKFYYKRNLNTRDDSPWSIMHAALSYGVDSQVQRGGPKGPTVNAIGWLCFNGPCKGGALLSLRDDKLQVREGPGFQGHSCQLLAILAQCKVKADYPIRVDGRQLQVWDLVQRELATCREGQELTFKLIGLSHYLASDATWKNDQGESWDMPRLVAAEVAGPLNGAACGGTHRLMALSYSLAKRRHGGHSIDGIWEKGAQRVAREFEQTLDWQNPDGSLSSQWFARRASWGDNDRKIQTTGHMLEWLVYTATAEQLDDPRLVRCVEYLTNLMIGHRFYDWEVGPRGHALRALRLYAERRFGESIVRR